MPCLIGCLALSMPRLALFLVWIFSDYLNTAYQTVLWPLLGFFFMPLTTLAYAWAWHQGNGSVAGFGLVVVVIAVLIDLGLLGTGESSRRTIRVRPK
ncbi:MAG TPA: hypothetical protein VKU02_08100 [Gemmataceae bacterium]|nr:hypothetical protein [Gemmataceae bacterium]